MQLSSKSNSPKIFNQIICGLHELAHYGDKGVTHVLSLIDPELPEIATFSGYANHQRTVLKFNDIIAPSPGRVMPTAEHITGILRFGDESAAASSVDKQNQILVHCHMGVSRSTAAMLTLLVQANPKEDDDRLFAILKNIRPQAWPNSVMIKLADEALGRDGRLFAALRRHYGRQVAEMPDLGKWMIGMGRQQEVDMAIVPFEI